ncbi:hypothetical protein CJ030_MR8G023195 [Morella rubra]|uniref:Uncharacterized protein n=1 Tax=Morella rubra TaxID=262757 RepID=A0A6A1USI3_9ROSI|nr:hypothetical protein CJ030_MR8G023195 [Morella rubra]
MEKGKKLVEEEEEEPQSPQRDSFFDNVASQEADVFEERGDNATSGYQAHCLGVEENLEGVEDGPDMDDPPHLHDHRSPNDKDTFDEDPPSLHDHYSLNDEDTNAEDPPNMTFRHSWLNVGIMLPPAWERRSSPPNASIATPTQPRHDAKAAQAHGGGVASRTRSSDRLRGLARGSGTPRQLFIDLTEPVVDTQTSVVTEQPQSDHGKRKANARVDNPSGLRMMKKKKSKKM